MAAWCPRVLFFLCVCVSISPTTGMYPGSPSTCRDHEWPTTHANSNSWSLDVFLLHDLDRPLCVLAL